MWYKSGSGAREQRVELGCRVVECFTEDSSHGRRRKDRQSAGAGRRQLCFFPRAASGKRILRSQLDLHYDVKDSFISPAPHYPQQVPASARALGLSLLQLYAPFG